MFKHIKNGIAIIIIEFQKLLRDVYNFGFFHLLSANFLISLLGFASQLFVAKFLTPLELGQIKTMQSFIVVSTTLAGFGFNTAVLKLCSEKRSIEEKTYIFKQNFYYTIGPIAVVMVGIFALARLNNLSPDENINEWMPVYIFVVPALTYSSLIMVYFQALKKIHLMSKVQVIISIVGFLFLVVGTFYYGLPGFIVATIITGYITLIPLFYLVSDIFNIRVKVKRVFSKSFFYAKWEVGTSVLTILVRNMDIFMLNYLVADRVGFGYYSLATIFITGLTLITATAQTIVGPHFSERNSDRKDFIRVLKKYGKLMVLMAFGVSIISALLVPKLIILAYGNDYKPAGLYFKILVLRYFLWSCYALIGPALGIGLGKVNYIFYTALISICLSIIFSYLFIVYFGLIGAAVAQAVACFITLIIVLFMTRHAIKMYFKNEWINC
jgi:O-antigen/teichoic acid export membrane protein